MSKVVRRTEVDWAESLIDKDGVLGRRYHGDCAQCGLPREVVFALPERPTPPSPGAYVTFGASGDTLVLFDAGQWVEIADMMALAAGLPAPTHAGPREQSGATLIPHPGAPRTGNQSVHPCTDVRATRKFDDGQTGRVPAWADPQGPGVHISGWRNPVGATTATTDQWRREQRTSGIPRSGADVWQG
jgi:hypothetical protein